MVVSYGRRARVETDHSVKGRGRAAVWRSGGLAVAEPTRPVAEFMTILPVAEAVFRTAERLIEAPMGDLWWAEPCAGTGNIFRQMPPDRRVGFDINPQDDGIIRSDFRDQSLDPAHPWCVLTNMPFGKLSLDDRVGAPLRLFEWAASQECVVAIGVITPHWFQGPKTENKLNPYFHRVHIEELPPESFTHNGKPAWCPTIFSLWVRRSDMRELIVIQKTHPDWEWLPLSRKSEGTAAQQMWGVGAGDIRPLDQLGRINDWRLYKIIKEIRPGTIERLKMIDWLSVVYLTLKAPRLYPQEVVAAYSAAYDAPGKGSIIC